MTYCCPGECPLSFWSSFAANFTKVRSRNDSGIYEMLAICRRSLLVVRFTLEDNRAVPTPVSLRMQPAVVHLAIVQCTIHVTSWSLSRPANRLVAELRSSTCVRRSGCLCEIAVVTYATCTAMKVEPLSRYHSSRSFHPDGST